MIAPHQKQKVLVIDDEHANRKILTNLLQDEVDIILAKNGQQGIERAKKHLPDLILLDLIMPEMDGYSVLEQLKKDPVTEDIAVVIVSGLDSTLDEAKGLNLGALDFISKPFHPEIAKSRVRNLLSLVRHKRAFQHLASHDGLTGIPNRRRFDETLEMEWHNAIRQQTPLALALFDVDHFKLYNDNYGHIKGDDTLKTVAALIAEVAQRPRDLAARYGGEEFALILPETDLEGAKQICQQMQSRLNQLSITHAFSPVADAITVSVGGVVAVPKQGAAPNEFLREVDAMLYRAKDEGRNRSIWHQRELN